jgi:hypothetical protein
MVKIRLGAERRVVQVNAFGPLAGTATERIEVQTCLIPLGSMAGLN